MALMTALAIGANLAGSLLANEGESNRRERVAQKQREALDKLQRSQSTAAFGMSETEGRLASGAVQGRLGSLAERGVLDSNVAAGEVAASVAPFEAMRQQRLQAFNRDIAAAEFQLAETGAAPGFESALGGALGDTGGFLALLEGVKQGRVGANKVGIDRNSKQRSFLDLDEAGTPVDQFQGFMQFS